jgi:hypothetical protein
MQGGGSSLRASPVRKAIYVSDPEWPAPNLTLLNHALHQAGWNAKPLLAL